MPTVTGYVIVTDNGAAGLDPGDVFSGSNTLGFDEFLYNPIGTGFVDYGALGDVSGRFFEIGGTEYFVPDDNTGFPTADGFVSSYEDAIEGTTGNDTLNGTGAGEYIQDTDGSIYNPTGDDTVFAGGGDDTILFGDGNDIIYGEDGDDTIGTWYTGSGTNTLDGGAGNDTIIGGEGDDQIIGGTGDDWLSGDYGSDVIYAGDGSDEIWVTDDHEHVVVHGGNGGTDWDILGFGNYATTQGVDVSFTGPENGTYDFVGTTTYGNFTDIEQVITTEYDDTLDSTASSADLLTYTLGGDDVVTTGSGDDTIYAGAGNDTLDGGAGDDEIHGDAGSDIFQGSAGNDQLYGGGDNDYFYIEDDEGTDTIDGGDGWDEFNVSQSTGGVTVTFTGNEAATYDFDATTAGGTFTDIEDIKGSNFADTIDASVTTDGIKTYTYGGDDTVTGGAGDDRIYGGDGDDTISGGAGSDQIYGDADDDTLDGGADTDFLYGGSGSDILRGGDGDDWLSGGTGADTFFVEIAGGSDTATDFDTTIVDGATVDQLDTSELTDGSNGAVLASDVVVTDDGSGNAVLTFPEGEQMTLLGVDPVAVTPSMLISMGVPCFTAGTRIATAKGLQPVERLRAGDMVQTVDNGMQALVWVGHKTLDCQALRDNEKLRPVLISAGALGNERDMWVSPQHGMIIPDDRGGRMVRAIHLARHAGQGFRVGHGRRGITYVHLMFETHQIVLAEGTPSESFFAGPQGLAALGPGPRSEILALFPDLAHGVLPETARARSILHPRELTRHVARQFNLARALR